jgi:plasmid maintenance system killer protein
MCRGIDERSRARKEKARALVTLFPEQHAAARKSDVARKLEAKERALDAAVREHELDMRLYRSQLATSCVECECCNTWSMRMQAEYRQWLEENVLAPLSTV